MLSRTEPSVLDYKNSLPTLVGEAVLGFWSWLSFWYEVFVFVLVLVRSFRFGTQFNTYVGRCCI